MIFSLAILTLNLVILTLSRPIDLYPRHLIGPPDRCAWFPEVCHSKRDDDEKPTSHIIKEAVKATNEAIDMLVKVPGDT